MHWVLSTQVRKLSAACMTMRTQNYKLPLGWLQCRVVRKYEYVNWSLWYDIFFVENGVIKTHNQQGYILYILIEFKLHDWFFMIFLF